MANWYRSDRGLRVGRYYLRGPRVQMSFIAFELGIWVSVNSLIDQYFYKNDINNMI